MTETTTSVRIVHLDRAELLFASEHLRTQIQALIVATAASRRAATMMDGIDTLEVACRHWRAANLLMGHSAQQVASAAEAALAIAEHLARPAPGRQPDREAD